MMQHFRRWFLPAKFHQRGDRVQRIEEEMRFYLHLQCLQMRSGELLLQGKRLHGLALGANL